VVRTLTRQFEQNLAQERLLAVLSSTFGALALVLAAVGLYGLLAYSVVQRTGEIGIRMALGARRDQVIRLILTQTCRLTAAGVVCGLAGAAILSGVLKTMLFGVTPLDPSTFGAMTVLFGTVAIVASLLPALRAASVEPFATLRQD
jgi:ABC-type antimicrobial peptide transport system permease subunit